MSESVVKRTVDPVRKVFKHIKSRPAVSRALVVCGLLLFAGIGVAMLHGGSAATSTTDLEAESGTLSGNAKIAADGNASGGKAVSFNSSGGSSGGTTTPITRFLGQTRPFADSSPWNTKTPSTTKWYDWSVLHTVNRVVVGNSNARMYPVQRYVAVFYAQETDPTWTLTLPAKNGWTYCPQGRGPAAAKTVKIHAPANIAVPAETGGDGSVVFVDGTHYYELWQTVINSSNKTITTTVTSPSDDGWAEGDIVSGSGFSSGGVRAGVRAADFSVIGGLITGHDISQGKIDHALAMLISNDMQVDGSVAPPLPFVAPATCLDTHNGTGKIMQGSKIGIPPGVAKPAGLSPAGSMIFDALQEYGAYVGDFVGGEWPMIAAETLTTNQDYFAAYENPWRANSNNAADYMVIAPLLRVANYQP